MYKICTNKNKSLENIKFLQDENKKDLSFSSSEKAKEYILKNQHNLDINNLSIFYISK